MEKQLHPHPVLPQAQMAEREVLHMLLRRTGNHSVALWSTSLCKYGAIYTVQRWWEQLSILQQCMNTHVIAKTFDLNNLPVTSLITITIFKLFG